MKTQPERAVTLTNAEHRRTLIPSAHASRERCAVMATSLASGETAATCVCVCVWGGGLLTPPAPPCPNVCRAIWTRHWVTVRTSRGTLCVNCELELGRTDQVYRPGPLNPTSLSERKGQRDVRVIRSLSSCWRVGWEPVTFVFV